MGYNVVVCRAVVIVQGSGDTIRWVFTSTFPVPKDVQLEVVFVSWYTLEAQTRIVGGPDDLFTVPRALFLKKQQRVICSPHARSVVVM